MVSKRLRPLFSIIVTNWNGEDWIVRCLSSLQLSARHTQLPFEIIVVDDNSSDQSIALIKKKFTKVRLIQNKKNKGYAYSTNRGVKAAKGKYVVLCNNDLAAKEEFIPELIKWFVDPDFKKNNEKLFGVSAKTLSWWDGKPNQLCMAAQLIGGRISQVWLDPKEAQECLFVQAGAAAYDRKKYLKLKGLNPIFHPGYWEDYDLSYQAAKQGWGNIYEPNAIALHHGGGSMVKRYGAKNVEELKARNHVIFEWLNITSPSLFVTYNMRLVYSVFKEWISGTEPRLTKALTQAIRLLPEIIKERFRRDSKVSDEKVLQTGRDFNRS